MLAPKTMPDESIADLLERDLEARDVMFDDRHQTAFRLFNGFMEGHPSLVVVLYAGTIVLHKYADIPSKGEAAIHTALQFLRTRLPWVHIMVLKTRNGLTESDKRGAVVQGSTPDRRVLVAVNSALFLSGNDYIEAPESLCADEYLQIEELIPVPEDFTGYAQTRLRSLSVDPAPFNHTTKIAVLKVRRKAESTEDSSIEEDTL